MYFNLIPDIQYPTRPIGFPFSEADYITAKNFFRRYQVNAEIFNYAVYFKKYSIKTGERLDTIANGVYGSPFYDWVIVLTNNMIDPRFDWPKEEIVLQKYVEEKYPGQDPYAEIHHYETNEHKIGGTVVLEKGIVVDKNYYTTNHYFNSSGSMVSVSGSILSRPVTIYEYESSVNESKREIYLLRSGYLEGFVSSFKTQNKYKESNDFISNKLKKAA